jgi:hypothetical protein
MQAFNVYLRRTTHGRVRWIDTVFYSDSPRVDVLEVRRSLVEHDGYDPGIIVRRAPKPRAKAVSA